MDRDSDDSFKTLLQIVALCLAIVFVSMIVHKASADLQALAAQHSGGG